MKLFIVTTKILLTRILLVFAWKHHYGLNSKFTEPKMSFFFICTIIFINYINRNPFYWTKDWLHVNSYSLNFPKQIWHIFTQAPRYTHKKYILVIWNARANGFCHWMTYVYTSTLTATMYTGIKIHQIHCRLHPLIITQHTRYTRPYFEYNLIPRPAAISNFYS